MRAVTLSLVSIAGLAGTAKAATTVEFLLSRDGVNFSNTLTSGGGGFHTYEVLVRVSTNNPSAIGLDSFSFQPTVSSWGPTDSLVPLTASFGNNHSTPLGTVPDSIGQYGRISPFAAIGISSNNPLVGHVHTNGSGGAPAGQSYLRIAVAHTTSWIGGAGNTTGALGPVLRQLSNVGRTASEPAFNGSTDRVHVFRFAVQVDETVGSRSELTFDAPLAGFWNHYQTSAPELREVYWYADMNEAEGSIHELPTVIPGRLIVPAPGCAVLILAGLAVPRRRRS